MAKTSAVFLNYFAFAILFVVGFIIVYIKNTEIIGFYHLFIVNIACTLYTISYFTSVEGMDLVPYAIGFSLIISGIFHTVCLIFIVMMISNLKVKYSDTYGTPINLPLIYKEHLEMFKRLMISTFSVCGVLLIIYGTQYDPPNGININFTQEMKSIGNIMYKPYPFAVLIITCAPLIMSSINVSIANNFSAITRQDLMR
uniref:Uncharacterized protein n=1 Tax=viral metagenome TaxID=1070528 RepID=A0A6C0L8K8_9ZZZZ